MKQYIQKIRELLNRKRGNGIRAPRMPGLPSIPGAAVTPAAGIPLRRTQIQLIPLLKHPVFQNCLMILVCAYFVADFVATAIRPLIPEIKAPRVALSSGVKRKSVTDYDLILTRNLFNEKGLIPNTDDMNTGFGPPVKTSLPLNLTGIIMVQDELKSVASVEDKGSNQVVAVRVNDYINSEAMVQKIEPTRVIFFNKGSGRREFVELPQDQITATIRKKSAPTVGTGIVKENENHYAIEQQALDKTLENFNEVLTQARCVPNFENGRPEGYRCFQIAKGSVYEQLGMQDNDVITSINGEPVNDISKAFTFLNQLKNKELSSFSITMKRNGRVITKNYDFR